MAAPLNGAGAEKWIEAPPEEAMQLQKPAPDDAIVLLPDEKKAA